MTTWLLVDATAVSHLLETAAWLEADPVGVRALVVGERPVADAVAAGGVAVQWFGEPDGRPAEAFAPAVAAAVAEAAPDVVLASTGPAGRALLGAVAASLAAPVFTMVTDVHLRDGVAIVTHDAYGGVARRTVTVPGPVLLTLDGGAEVSSGGAATPGAVEDVSGSVRAVHETVRVLGTRENDRPAADLRSASTIVAVGRGVRLREDLAIVERLASALGAPLACSRPLVEGEGWFAPDRYIGITGQHVAPALHVAVGISGQLHHTVGARDARTVVVVNSDKDAPYVQEADYAIVGDLHAIVPALTEALEHRGPRTTTALAGSGEPGEPGEPRWHRGAGGPAGPGGWRGQGGPGRHG